MAKSQNNVEIPGSLFSSEKISQQAMFDSIMSERASRRQGTHKVKSRAEVSGTNKKPWQQKGTGKARTSSLRTPVFVGGGRAFGPTVERNYTLKVNKRVKKLAYVSALTELANANSVIVEKVSLDNISTKALVAKLQDLKVNNLRHILLVTNDTKVFLSARNLQNVVTTKVTSLQVEQLVAADVLIISNEDIEHLRHVLVREQIEEVK